MKRETTAVVGADGVLTVTMPFGLEHAGRSVRVVVEDAKPAMTQEEWQAFIARTAGMWQGDFERDQGEYTERDPL